MKKKVVPKDIQFKFRFKILTWQKIHNLIENVHKYYSIMVLYDVIVSQSSKPTYVQHKFKACKKCNHV